MTNGQVKLEVLFPTRSLKLSSDKPAHWCPLRNNGYLKQSDACVPDETKLS